MILRRVIAHFHKQEWTAIFLDFLIVVAGILIAFQITNWNETRQDRQREALILDRLQADFSQLRTLSTVSIKIHERNFDGLDAVVRALEDGAIAPGDQTQFESGLRWAYNYTPLAGRSGTFIEILSSAQVNLIRDEVLRAALINYDQLVMDSETGFLHIRSLQSIMAPAFTRHFTLSARKRIEFIFGSETDADRQAFSKLAALGDYDFAAMLADPLFRDAAEELRDMQAYYLGWHSNQRTLIENICERLALSANRPCAPLQENEATP